jgi:hypothetical protein
MTRLALLLGIAACILGIWTMPTYAQQPPNPCRPRADWLRSLSADPYFEAIVARRLNRQGAMVEVTANPETGTWTELTTRPNNTALACATSEGEGWTALEYQIGEPS